MTKSYTILYQEIAYDRTYSIEREGTYAEVEDWAIEQKDLNGWDCFGIVDQETDQWAVEETA